MEQLIKDIGSYWFVPLFGEYYKIIGLGYHDNRRMYQLLCADGSEQHCQEYNLSDHIQITEDEYLLGTIQ